MGCDVGGGRVYAHSIAAGTDAPSLVAIDQFTGELLWKWSKDSCGWAPPLYYDEKVYLYSSGFNVFDAATGELLDHYAEFPITEEGGTNSRSVTDGERIYFKNGGTRMFAFELLD